MGVVQVGAHEQQSLAGAQPELVASREDHVGEVDAEGVGPTASGDQAGDRQLCTLQIDGITAAVA
jgi:hypothetical protein